MSRVVLEIQNGPDRRGTWGHKEKEFMADFILVARRSLTEDEYRVFRYRFLLGADWKLCCPRLKIDRGTYFNYVYRIMAKLGRVFAELEPYPLFPLSDYFHGSHRERRGAAIMPKEQKVVPIRPPVPRPFEQNDPDDEPVRQVA